MQQQSILYTSAVCIIKIMSNKRKMNKLVIQKKKNKEGETKPSTLDLNKAHLELLGLTVMA
jgi:hypothetical protein